MRTILQYAEQMRRLTHRCMQSLGEELDLSQLEMELLLFLHNDPELNTARDVVAYRGFARSNVSTAVESLEKKGWLTVVPDAQSRRVKRLCLRTERREAIERLFVRQNEILKVLTSDFTPEEEETLRVLLDRCGRNVTRALERMEGSCRA